MRARGEAEARVGAGVVRPRPRLRQPPLGRRAGVDADGERVGGRAGRLHPSRDHVGAPRRHRHGVPDGASGGPRYHVAPTGGRRVGHDRHAGADGPRLGLERRRGDGGGRRAVVVVGRRRRGRGGRGGGGRRARRRGARGRGGGRGGRRAGRGGGARRRQGERVEAHPVLALRHHERVRARAQVERGAGDPRPVRAGAARHGQRPRRAAVDGVGELVARRARGDGAVGEHVGRGGRDGEAVGDPARARAAGLHHIPPALRRAAGGERHRRRQGARLRLEGDRLRGRRGRRGDDGAGRGGRGGGAARDGDLGGGGVVGGVVRRRGDRVRAGRAGHRPVLAPRCGVVGADQRSVDGELDAVHGGVVGGVDGDRDRARDRRSVGRTGDRDGGQRGVDPGAGLSWVADGDRALDVRRGGERVGAVARIGGGLLGADGRTGRAGEVALLDRVAALVVLGGVRRQLDVPAPAVVHLRAPDQVVVTAQLDVAALERQRLVVEAAVTVLDPVVVRVLLHVEALAAEGVDRRVADDDAVAGVVGVEGLVGRLGARADVDALGVVVLVLAAVVARGEHPAPLDHRVDHQRGGGAVAEPHALAACAAQEHVGDAGARDVAGGDVGAHVDELGVDRLALHPVLEPPHGGEAGGVRAAGDPGLAVHREAVEDVVAVADGHHVAAGALALDHGLVAAAHALAALRALDGDRARRCARGLGDDRLRVLARGEGDRRSRSGEVERLLDGLERHAGVGAGVGVGAGRGDEVGGARGVGRGPQPGEARQDGDGQADAEQGARTRTGGAAVQH